MGKWGAPALGDRLNTVFGKGTNRHGASAGRGSGHRLLGTNGPTTYGLNREWRLTMATILRPFQDHRRPPWRRPSPGSKLCRDDWKPLVGDRHPDELSPEVTSPFVG